MIGSLIVLSNAEAAKLLGSASTSNRNVNFIDDPTNFAIDFSGANPGPDGTVCVERKKYVDKTEKDQLKECFVQNVTQCYYTYVTEYSEAEQEKCVDFYWKTCKIVFKERVFNATSRMCKRPLIKRCDSEGYSNSNNDAKIVCETFFETACNTTDVVPAPGDEPLPVTFCDKIPRKICAPDTCRVVEDAEICEESTDQSTIDEPIELCDLQPQKHCSQVKIAVPRLVPEKKCRQVEKEICNTQLVHPHEVKKPVFIKYCTKKEKLSSPNRDSYLPPPGPPPPPFKPVVANPPSIYSGPPPPVYSSPPPQQPTYTRSSYNAPSQRLKRDPNLVADGAPLVIEASNAAYDQHDSSKVPKSSWTSPNSRIDNTEDPEFSKRSSRSLSLDDLEDYQPWNPITKRYDAQI